MAEATQTDEADELENPIKVRWTGKTRQKITGRNQDMAHPEQNQKAVHVRDALTRQKTNVVIHTVAEAKSMITEMDSYKNGAGPEGRVWMNGPAAESCRRVREDIISELEDRGYVLDYSPRGNVREIVHENDRTESEDDDEDEDLESEDEDELTKISINDLTKPEMNEVIPEREFFIVGYESNRTDKDYLEQTVQEPTGSKGYHHYHVRGTITGYDPEDEDRGIGFTKGRLNATNATLGTPAYVKIPDYDPIEKIDFTVRFRMEDGNYSTASTDDGVIEGVTETYDYDHLPYDVDLSNAEAFRWEKKEGNYVKRARFDLVVPMTLPASLDEDEVIDTAEKRLPDRCLWEEDVPEIGNHIEELDNNFMGGKRKRNHRRKRVIVDATIDERTPK